MRSWLVALAAWMLVAAPGTSRAQSVDGYHSILVFPVVVDSASFTQRFNFTTPNAKPVTVRSTFYPGLGTPQATIGKVTCSEITFGGRLEVASLRDLCPGLVAGSVFGFLVMQSAPSSDGMYSDIPVFAGFSRVSNAAGAGFSVEGFGGHNFTSANTVVTGLRRTAATADSPAYQTNCFIGNMAELGSGSGLAKTVDITLYTSSYAFPSEVTLFPGQFIRLLDVFSSIGAFAGDYTNVNIVFTARGGLEATNRPGLLTFCTVQDNTSFGADFRIGKTSYGSMGIGSNDGLTAREVMATKDTLERVFEIPAGSAANTHVVYFRHPDTVQCSLVQTAAPNAVLTPADGLELRVLNASGAVIGGGDNAVTTGPIFLGDKAAASRGFNGIYTVQVESNESNTGVNRPYGLYCSSGSGNTFNYPLLQYKEPVDRF